MYESTVEIDLHGKNVHQARIAIDAALRRANAATCRIRVIHGCHGGTALLDFVQTEYANHPKVKRIRLLSNRGATELILREY